MEGACGMQAPSAASASCEPAGVASGRVAGWFAPRPTCVGCASMQLFPGRLGEAAPAELLASEVVDWMRQRSACSSRFRASARRRAIICRCRLRPFRSPQHAGVGASHRADHPALAQPRSRQRPQTPPRQAARPRRRRTQRVPSPDARRAIPAPPTGSTTMLLMIDNYECRPPGALDVQRSSVSC